MEGTGSCAGSLGLVLLCSVNDTDPFMGLRCRGQYEGDRGASSGSSMEGGCRVMAGAGKARVGDDPELDLW